MKLATAAIAIGIITAGLCDDPANAGTMEDAGILAIAATTCKQNVPDVIFMPVVQKVAVENSINVSDAIKLIVAQAQIMQVELIDNGKLEQFCKIMSGGR
jgi:hypothetical protein